MPGTKYATISTELTSVSIQTSHFKSLLNCSTKSTNSSKGNMPLTVCFFLVWHHIAIIWLTTFLIFNLTRIVWLHLLALISDENIFYSQLSQCLSAFLLYLSFPLSPPPRGIQGQASVQRISKQPVYRGLVCFTVPAGGLMRVNRGQGRLRLHSSTLTEGRSLFRPHILLVQ